MKRRYKEMINTRRLYKLEGSLYGRPEFNKMTRQISLSALKKIALHIWNTERFDQNFPCIQFGRGVPHNNEQFSWCDGETIELASKQRDVMTLIHELVHAIGYDYHDTKFVKENLRLLKKYSTLNAELLDDTYSVLL